MNFSSMEYFVVLEQERNFTRAAERLHMTQQSLSSHIAAMEKELGCQLFVRHIPLDLTYAGEVMLRYAGHFQKEHENLLTKVKHFYVVGFQFIYLRFIHDKKTGAISQPTFVMRISVYWYTSMTLA